MGNFSISFCRNEKLGLGMYFASSERKEIFERMGKVSSPSIKASESAFCWFSVDDKYMSLTFFKFVY